MSRLLYTFIKEAKEKKKRDPLLTGSDLVGAAGGAVGGGLVGGLGAEAILANTDLMKNVGRSSTAADLEDLKRSSGELYRQYSSSKGKGRAFLDQESIIEKAKEIMNADQVAETRRLLNEVDGGVYDPGRGAFADDMFKKLRDQGPHYNPLLHTIYSRKGAHDAVHAHEMGHATGLRNNKLFSKIDPVARSLGGFAQMGTLGYGGAQALRARGKSDEEKEDRYRKVRNAGLLGLGAGMPTLGEEARATYRALKYAPIGRRAEYAKVLAPAYGTYLSTLAAPSGLQAILAERARRKAKKRQKKK